MSFKVLASLLTLAVVASAQQPIYAQCGGIGFTGGTSCASGTVCTFMNNYYSQCLPGAAAPAPTQAPPAPVNPPPTPPVTVQPAPAPSGSTLNALAKAKGKKYFGTATDNSEINDASYINILASEFGQITPANSMKWDATEPTRGQFSFANGDAIANLAKKNGQLLRGHNCVWYSQLPSWVSNSGFNASTITSVIQTHTTTVVNRYKGQVYAWDVVNEPFNEDGTFRNDVFQQLLGTNYITIALNAARAADPNAKLYINEYNIEYTGAKATGMLNLVKQLKAAGTPLDGVGLQAHFIVGQIPSSFQSILQQFTALGVEVAITELDIRMPTPSSAANLAQQQKDYQTVIAACKAVTGCIGMTIWDFTDKYSWVPNTFSGQGAALPWDNNLQKKPAYTGIVNALNS